MSRNYSSLALAKKLGAIFACVIAAACADKAFHPVFNASSKIQLQFNAVGAQQVNAAGKRQVLVVAAAYKSTVLTQETDSFRILAGPLVVQVTGATQSVTLNVDITGCLADPTRMGSQTGCTVWYGVWLHDSATFSADTSDGFDKHAYDYSFLSVDVAPGKAPVVPAINLSTTRYSIFEFDGDESLRLGGPLSQAQFNGPMTGTVTGLAAGAPPVLFTLTNTFMCASPTNCATGFNSGQLAIFQNGTWTRVSAPPGVPQFNDVAAFSPNDVYLAGQGGIYHFDGTSISFVGGTGTENVVSIGAVTSGTSKFVVAGTSAGNAWFGNTTSWTKSQVSTNGATIDAACVTGPNEAFAMNSSTGTLYRFNGTSWTAAPSIFTGQKSDLQCPGPGLAYVAVQSVGIIGWNGSTWTAIPSPPHLGRVAAVSSSEIYVAADSGSSVRDFYKYNGSGWILIAQSQFTQQMIGRPWADPRGGAAYFHSSSFGRIDVAAVGGSHPVSYGTSIHDAIMTSASSAFAVGWNNFLARWNGTTWTVDRPPSGTPNIRALAGVWSDGPSNAWAVGNAATILHWDGTKWSVVSDILHPIAGVDNYNAVWGTGSDVWIAGANSVLHCRSVSACSNDPVSGGDSLYGIWGTSSTNAWAVGAHGKIMHYDGAQWTSVTTPTAHRITRVWGSGASDVWAVGDTALVHYDGTSWTNNAAGLSKLYENVGPALIQPSTNAFEVGLWGSGPKDVYVGTWLGQIYRWDGMQWSQMTTPQAQNGGSGRVVAITGYPGGCAIALIDGSIGSATPTLWRGVGPAGCLSSPMPSTTPWP
jgi:hypothetical protein